MIVTMIEIISTSDEKQMSEWDFFNKMRYGNTTKH